MSTPFAHLHPAVRDMLALEDNKRIQALQRDRWIDYPRASEAINRLQGSSYFSCKLTRSA